MARKPLIRSKTLPYHLYGRSNNRESFYLPLNEVWRIFLNHLGEAIEKRGLQVHAFVLMSNHYHLLASTTGEDVDQVMCRLLKGISDEINSKASRINHVFGGPYKWTLVDHWFYYHHVLRYIYQNPIRAGICYDCRNYAYSSIRAVLNQESSLLIASHPFERPTLQLVETQGYPNWITWLNEPYDKIHVKSMRLALSRRKFKFGRDRNSRSVPANFILPQSSDLS